MSLQLTILCENSVERILPGGLIAEHGFACHLHSTDGDYLFDTGSGLGLQHNCKQLGIDLSVLRGIVLSHGHCDHTGGLLTALQQSSSLPVYAHPKLFGPRYSGGAKQQREIGLPWPRADLERCGAQFQLSRRAQRLTEQLLLSGEIPRKQQTAHLDPQLYIKDPAGQEKVDPLADDMSLFITTEKGLVILLGCAHAGLYNIIEHAREVTGLKKIHMLLGGTHLKASTEEHLASTIEQLDQYDIDWIGASHCTGLRQSQKLANHFGERFFYASVGTVLEI